MPYLILQDYYSTIQDENLQQILNSADSFRLVKQSTALTEIKSYLDQRFDTSAEFTDTVQFSYTDEYFAKQRVYLDADAYVPASTYNTNALTLSNGNVYKAKQDDITGAFDGTKWDLLGAQYDLFYVTLPAEEFDCDKIYAKDDEVFRKDKVYKALRDSALLTNGAKLQYGEYSAVPGPNEYPEDPNQIQWEVQDSGEDYIVTETWPTDETIYTAGDNRNQRLVEMNVQMSIYKLSPRISPMNVPDVWVKNYDDCIKDLKAFARGDRHLDMPVKQPKKHRVSWGSSVRNINNY